MSSVYDILKNEYDIKFFDETNTFKIYKAFKKIENKEVILKIINKNQLKLGDYDFLLEQIKNEEEINKLCECENIVNLIRKFEIENNIIFEFEPYTKNLMKYLKEKGDLRRNIDMFKNLVLSLAKSLKTLQSKKVMHRDINPNNVFLCDNNNDIIKLGNFGCSIYIKDNQYDPIGTIVYSAPEIIKNLKYDEKCDLWSLGITLYQLYFGILPYEENNQIATLNIIMKTIYNPEQFNIKKTYIPTLDNLFNKLLKIDPKKRMSYKEFFDCVFNDKFMFINEEIKLKIEEQKKQDDLNNRINEGLNLEEENLKIINKVKSFVGGNHFPDTINYPQKEINEEEKYNNIIYYDENIDDIKNKKSIFSDSDIFEKNTNGAFILCTNKISLNMVKEEIIKNYKRDKRIAFNLIISGKQFNQIKKFLEDNKEFDDCINNICIYCWKLKDYINLKYTIPKLHNDIYNRPSEVVKFINKYSSKDIKPYPFTKLITYQDYLDKYKYRHLEISLFYGDLTKDSFDKYLKEMESLINKEYQENKIKNKQLLLNSFAKFDLNKDLEELDKLIIKEYTKNTFFADLNKWSMDDFNLNLNESVSYFTARLMYSLNEYAKKKNKYINEKRTIFRGIKIPYTSLLEYERAINKIIIFSAFTSTSEEEEFALNWASRKDSKELFEANKLFSIIYYITNLYENEWISNGINVQELAQYKNEKEYVFQPFSFYYVEKVNINLKKYTADIYLKTIGKTEILEEKIRLGKIIEYNKEKNIIQIKNE